MKQTVFSKILAGEIPNYTVYEDEHTLAFLDISPCAKGHTLVIPKTYAETISDADEDVLSALFRAVQKTIQRIDAVLNPDGYNIGLNHGDAGGQAVPHVHVHIIPRWNGDGGTSMHSIVSNPGDMSVEEVAALFS